MTRAEAWLTGVGAVLALAPVVLVLAWQLLDGFVAEPSIGFDREYRLDVFFGALLVGVPGLYLVAALALPDRRALRAVLTTAAALLLFMASIVTYLITFPATALAAVAAVVTMRRVDAGDRDELGPAAAFVPIAVALWLVAGALMLDRTADCSSTVSLVSGTSSSCSTGLQALDGAAILGLVAAPPLLIAFLWRSPQQRPQL